VEGSDVRRLVQDPALRESLQRKGRVIFSAEPTRDLALALLSPCSSDQIRQYRCIIRAPAACATRVPVHPGVNQLSDPAPLGVA